MAANRPLLASDEAATYYRISTTWKKLDVTHADCYFELLPDTGENYQSKLEITQRDPRPFLELEAFCARSSRRRWY